MIETNHRAFDILVHPEKCVECSICQLRCSFRFTKTFNPARAAIVIRKLDGQLGADISFTEECDSCGICARYCPYGALEIRRK
jgi:NAD-dependent dihydropyrimidine dehydrogenase PreA subunit